jgi:hypothetical protein
MLGHKDEMMGVIFYVGLPSFLEPSRVKPVQTMIRKKTQSAKKGGKDYNNGKQEV